MKSARRVLPGLADRTQGRETDHVSFLFDRKHFRRARWPALPRPAMAAPWIWRSSGELFAHCMAASRILGVDADFAAELASTRAASSDLPDRQVWPASGMVPGFRREEPGQRHMSHMYPLYPGSEFTLAPQSPEFWKASRVSLERRLAAGGAYTGWSRAWAINFWARLLDGEKAWESFCSSSSTAPAPICSTRIRPVPAGFSKSTATSAALRRWRRCCCKATKEK